MRLTGKITAVTLAGVMMLGCMSGCEKKTSGTTLPVYSTYSTAKVTQNVKDTVPYEKLEAAVNIQMMKNETEGSQLIVTAKDSDIKAYNLKTADLVDAAGNKISKDSISVYHQKYLKITKEFNPLNEEYIAGDSVPDMLLPLGIAVEYGENKVKKGQNQGITIEVTTDRDTVPGTYKGEFVLDLDGKEYEIPVTVEVWDIEYVGKRDYQSSFLIYRNSLIRGEYEASDELVDRYVDFLLDYKVNSWIVKDDDSVEKTVADAIRLFENDNYNSIYIPKTLQAGYTADSAEAQAIVDYIVALAKISTPEKPYIDYVYIYPTYFDEADAWEEKWADVDKVFEVGGEWDKTLVKALAAVKNTDEYRAFDAAFKAQVDHAVSNIPAVFPNTTFRKDWVEDSHVTFCPYISIFGDDAASQQYEEAAAKYNDSELWAYTCCFPNYPNPTFHTDDYNLGSRISGWMSKKFNVNGYLYWAVNIYQGINTEPWRDVDVYETAVRAGDCGGDGFLLYPGAYYGSEYPFASNRLVAFRDGMDDYDMLCVYEQLLQEKAKEYGVTIDFDDYVNDLYDSLFADASYYTDDSLVVAAREELANRILALKSEDGFMATAGKGVATIYAAKSSLVIDGETVNGEAIGAGYQYLVENKDAKAKEVKIEANAEYLVKIPAVQTVVSFAENKGNLKVTDESTVGYADGKAQLSVASVYRSDDKVLDGATLRFSPNVKLAVEDLANAKSIHFTIENTGNADVDFELRLLNAEGIATKAGTGYVGVGGSREFRIDLDSRTFTEEVLKGITEMRFVFDNVNDDKTALEPTHNFALGDVWIEK